jgi:hypothetical protein
MGYTYPAARFPGIVAAVALFGLWMLTTWALEGRIGTLRRPDAAADRAIYALTANILIGIVLGVVLLRSMVRRRILTRTAAGFGAATPSSARVLIALLSGFALFALAGVPSPSFIVPINAFAQVLVVSAAEVVVCWALLGATAEALLKGRGRIISRIGAAAVAAISFGVYHFAHSSPFNTPDMAALLMAVGLVTGTFFFVMRDVYATILFHNFLAMSGVVQVLEASGQISLFTKLQPHLLITAIISIGALGLSDRFLLRGTRAKRL